MNAAGKAFEIVFVSSDRADADMKKYMSDYNMPWIALKFDSAKKDALVSRFSVRGIPHLAIIDADGTLLSNNARSDVQNAGADAYESW